MRFLFRKINLRLKWPWSLTSWSMPRTYLDVKLNALSISVVKIWGSYLKNQFDIEITLILDLKVKVKVTISWPPLNPTTFLRKVFLQNAYLQRYSHPLIKMGHRVYIWLYESNFTSTVTGQNCKMAKNGVFCSILAPKYNPRVLE